MATRRPTPKARCPFTLVTDGGTIQFPTPIDDLDSFREWLDSDPTQARLKAGFIAGRTWVDACDERDVTHARVKSCITSALTAVVAERDLGHLFAKHVRVTNRERELCADPDAVFAGRASFASGRLKRDPPRTRGVVELNGTPDMVLEVVSRSSERKDREELVTAYWEAGVTEYWLADGRATPCEIVILARGPEGFVAVPRRGRWTRSAVFGKSFRLTRGQEETGEELFTLEVK